MAKPPKKHLAIDPEQIRIINAIRNKLEDMGIFSPTHSEIIEALNLKGSPPQVVLKKIQQMRGINT